MAAIPLALVWQETVMLETATSNAEVVPESISLGGRTALELALSSVNAATFLIYEIT